MRNEDINNGAGKFLSAVYEDPNAERDALAYCLEGGFHEARTMLASQDFTDSNLRAVWDAMEAAKADKNIDLTTVCDALEGRMEGDMRARVRLLADITSAPDYTSSRGRSAIPMLRELTLKRRLQRVIKSAAVAAGSNVDPDKIVFELVEGAREVQDELSTSMMPGAIDLTTPMPAPIALVERGGDQILHLGDIQMIDGKSKSGKSSVCTAIAAAVLGGRAPNCLGFNATMEGARVLWIDTEQHPRNTAVMARRVLRAAGLATNVNCPRFAILSWRGKTPAEQTRLLFRAARHFRPQLMVIDGIADLVDDFNDIAESNEIVTRLMGLALELDAAILCVLHTNPGGKGADQKATGMLGSLVYKKLSIEIQVTASDDSMDALREVRFLKARNGNPEKFWFVIDENGPYLCTPAPTTETSTVKLRALMASVFRPGEVLTYTDCVTRIVNTGISDRTAKYKIRQAREHHILAETDNGLYIPQDDDLPMS